jgi:Tfp pilus assembly protein PilN
MSDIDFLPSSYRQMTVHRKANVWRLLAGGVFIAMIGVSAIYQHLLRREALADLARTGPLYDQAQALTQQQAELKRQLQLATTEAELFTYLRHPWPATQVLATALSPLPDSITLQQIRLFQDQPQLVATAASAPQPPKKPTEPEPAALRDLRQLRQENDSRPRVLILSGITTDTAALQQYLLVLGTSELFVKTELGSLETDTTDHSGAMHFTARLVVRPGYGQPGGPAVQTNAAARTSTKITNL